MNLHPPQIATLQIIRFRDGSTHTSSDPVVREEPLEIRVRGESIAVTMRTPGHDEELACGFLVSEGVIKSRADVAEVAPCLSANSSARGNILNVFLVPSVPFDLDQLSRHTFASSSCGLCGKATIESVQQQFPPVPSEGKVTSGVLLHLPPKLRQAQETFSQTGGLHAAGLFDLQGNLQVLREDVGRHNAVDKVIGWAFLNGLLPLSHSLLLVSGRVSFEIMQKALAARIPLVAAISAPSALAVEFAAESNQTLVAFLRGSSFNVYSCPRRVIFE